MNRFNLSRLRNLSLATLSAVCAYKYHDGGEESHCKNDINVASPSLLREKKKKNGRQQLSTNDLEKHVLLKEKISLEEASLLTEDLINRVIQEFGAPGISVAISVNGDTVYHRGFGFSDVENKVECTEDTVMRIASISKPITMTALARLIDDGKVDLDKSLNSYILDYPTLKFKGELCEKPITLRHLVSHLSGIRHYKKEKDELSNKEFLIKTHFSSTKDAMALFNQDELLSEPGEQFEYTTYGWTVVSAVIEEITKKEFTSVITCLFEDMGLGQTYLDLWDPIIYHRSRYYIKKDGKIVNAPYVDNSCKWAGGGILSTVVDLARFGNIMLYSYQWRRELSESPIGFLKPETVELIWTPVEKTKMAWDKDGHYGMGWGIVRKREIAPFCKEQRFYVSHTGGAVGASSVLLILPGNHENSPPNGVVVAIITNLEAVSLAKVAFKIALLFEKTMSVDQ